MKPTISFFICFSYCFISSLIFASPPLIHHELTVTLNTDQSNASIHDIVTIPHSIIQSISSFSLSKNSKIKKIIFNGETISSVVSADGFLKFNLPKYAETDVIGPSKLVPYKFPTVIWKLCSFLVRTFSTHNQKSKTNQSSKLPFKLKVKPPQT